MEYIYLYIFVYDTNKEITRIFFLSNIVVKKKKNQVKKLDKWFKNKFLNK